MYLTEEQYHKIAGHLPKQRGNVDIENRDLLEALIFRCKTGTPWRDMPQSYGKWHAIYTRINRWAKNGVLQRVYAALASEELQAATVFGLDSTASKAHPDAHGAEKKRRTGDRQDARGLEHEDSRPGGQRHRHIRLFTDRWERARRGGGQTAAGNA